VLPATLALLAKAWPPILVLQIMRVFISHSVLEKYEDVVGRTRNTRRVCGGIQRAARRFISMTWELSRQL
jgi:hypothetical protein